MFQNMEYVYEVYKEKSFSKAAKNLYVTQPCLSAMVKKVENKLGVPIFNRNVKQWVEDFEDITVNIYNTVRLTFNTLVGSIT